MDNDKHGMLVIVWAEVAHLLRQPERAEQATPKTPVCDTLADTLMADPSGEMSGWAREY